MVNVREVLAEAQELIGPRPEAALKLLLESRAKFIEVPDMYDMILGRAAIASAEPEAGLYYLADAIAKGAPTPRLLRVYGEALLAVGRIEEAGEKLAAAVAGGSPVETMPVSLRMVLQDHIARHPDLQVIAPRLNHLVLTEFGVLDHQAKVLLIYTPKVACTILKATVVMNSQSREIYEASGQAIHEFVGKEKSEDALMEALADPRVFRFAVVREPATRILSAYLNKFVPNPPKEPLGLLLNKKRTISVSQRIAGVSQDYTRGISFEEFVHYLAQAHDLELDTHWMPQTRILGPDVKAYDHIGRFEELQTTFKLLARRFGYVAQQDSSVHLVGQRDHATRYDASTNIKEPYRALPAELRKLGSIYPKQDLFLVPNLRDILNRRFASDASLHASI